MKTEAQKFMGWVKKLSKRNPNDIRKECIKTELEFLKYIENIITVNEANLEAAIEEIRDRVDELEPNEFHLWHDKKT